MVLSFVGCGSEAFFSKPHPVCFIRADDSRERRADLSILQERQAAISARSRSTRVRISSRIGRTSTLPPARWRSQPAAICDLPGLCTHTKSTVGGCGAFLSTSLRQNHKSPPSPRVLRVDSAETCGLNGDL